jgi:ABC-type phosphate transport system substrate-binding protein
MYFHGVQPPYVLASDEAVIRFVVSTPGAIGYVSNCLADRRVTVVARLENGPGCPR